MIDLLRNDRSTVRHTMQAVYQRYFRAHVGEYSLVLAIVSIAAIALIH